TPGPHRPAGRATSAVIAGLGTQRSQPTCKDAYSMKRIILASASAAALLAAGAAVAAPASEVVQNGSGHNATVTQTGATGDTDAWVTQNGVDNNAGVNQAGGDNNNATIEQ